MRLEGASKIVTEVWSATTAGGRGKLKGSHSCSFRTIAVKIKGVCVCILHIKYKKKNLRQQHIRAVLEKATVPLRLETQPLTGVGWSMDVSWEFPLVTSLPFVTSMRLRILPPESTNRVALSPRVQTNHKRLLIGSFGRRRSLHCPRESRSWLTSWSKRSRSAFPALRTWAWSGGRGMFHFTSSKNMIRHLLSSF